MIGSVFRSKKFFILLVIVIGLFIYTMMSKDYFNIPTHHEQTNVKRGNKDAVDENEDAKSDEKPHQLELDFQSQTTSNPTLADEPDQTELSTLAESNPFTDKKQSSNSLVEQEQDALNIVTPNPFLKPLFSDQEDEVKVEQGFSLNSAASNSSSTAMNGNEVFSEQNNDGQDRRQRQHSASEDFLGHNVFMSQENPKQNWTEQQSFSKPKVEIDGLLKRLLNDEPNTHLHPFSICPFLAIRETKTNPWTSTTTDLLSEVSCRPKKPSEAACKEAYLAYAIELSPLKCEAQGTVNELCSFKEDGNIQCNISLCEDGYIYLSGVDPDYGIVRNENTAIFVKSNRELEHLVHEFKEPNAENGFNFYFLKCRRRRRSITSQYMEQLVIFPPMITNGPSLEPSLIDINILVLDSISRAHFYRSMPKAVEALRRIVHDSSLDATVLDFELFQSMADYTFHNIRAFMSGKTDFEYKAHQDQHYEIEYLFEIMKSKGYHTLLQEDSCWYDEWGSLFTDNLFQGKRPQTLEDFNSRWSAFSKKVNNYYVDDFGLSHFSCEALQRYNITNQFNRPKKICFGGKVFAEYFLDYTEEVFLQKQTSKKPIFAYTHLNTGHEISGTRIKQIDQRFSQFFVNMARKERTLTLVFSDHGPKTTPYAFHTIDGRAEIYDSLLFAILPEKTATFLGFQRTKALITNQKRLMTALELHSAVISIGNKEKENTGSYLLEGIFAEIPSNRSCADISMKSAAICKCDDWDETFPINHSPFIWLAELALGTLNNRIQNEYMQDPDARSGFGNCQRLIGKTFEKIRRRSVDGDKFVVTMDLIVKPESEIFEVQVEYPKKPSRYNNNVTVTHLSRISIYRRFDKCKDESVNLTICVCKSRSYNTQGNRQWININTRRNLLRVLTRAKNFDAEVKFTDLHSSCLVMVTRSHASRTSVFEIANACSDRSYKVKVTGKSRGKSIVSTQLPLSLTVEPLTAHFLFSVYHIEKPYGYKATTSYKAYFIN